MFKDWVSVLTDVPLTDLDLSPLSRLSRDHWPVQVQDHTRYFCYMHQRGAMESQPGVSLPLSADNLEDVILTPVDADLEAFCDNLLQVGPVVNDSL